MELFDQSGDDAAVSQLANTCTLKKTKKQKKTHTLVPDLLHFAHTVLDHSKLTAYDFEKSD